jgi:hypothetical protein
VSAQKAPRCARGHPVWVGDGPPEEGWCDGNCGDYPIVSVAEALIRDGDGKPLPGKARGPLDGLIEAWCSECGELTDWLSDTPAARGPAIRIAAAHAAEVHDNLVDAVGWVR